MTTKQSKAFSAPSKFGSPIIRAAKRGRPFAAAGSLSNPNVVTPKAPKLTQPKLGSSPRLPSMPGLKNR